MRALLITNSDYKKLAKLKQKESRDSYKKFTQKKKTHLKDERLKAFLKLCTDDFNPMLYTIPFKCYFSFYLYLYLKNRAERFEFDIDKYQYLFSKPFDINVSEIARVAGVPVNTVKSALKELIKYEFLLYTDILSSDKPNVSKTAIF